MDSEKVKTKQTEAAIDPVCGMDVNPDTAKFKLEQAGKMYYFCSSHCREKFRANPKDYLSASRSSRHVGAQVVEITPSKATEKSGTQPRPISASSSARWTSRYGRSARGGVRSVGWRSNRRALLPLRRSSTPVRCTRRSCVRHRVRARFAAWRLSPER